MGDESADRTSLVLFPAGYAPETSLSNLDLADALWSRSTARRARPFPHDPADPLERLVLREKGIRWVGEEIAARRYDSE